MTDRQHIWIRTGASALVGTAMVIAAPALITTTASAATQGISITKSGYVPMNQTIKVGDVVSFTNADTDAHQVVFKQTTGFTCTVTPLVIEPTKTQSCTFTVANTYTYSDPNHSGSSYRGAITVQSSPSPSPSPSVSPTISLTADRDVVGYGTAVTLSGKTSSSASGTAVDIMAKQSGETAFAKVATTMTNAGGVFSIAVKPDIETIYRADSQSGSTKVSSSTATVLVKPNVTLVKRFVRGKYAAMTSKVLSSMSYASHTLLVQRQNRLGGWTTLRTVTINTYSAAPFRVRIPSGISRLRTLLTTAQAGAGYVASASNTVEVRR